MPVIPQGDQAPSTRQLYRLCQSCDTIFRGSLALKGLSEDEEQHLLHQNYNDLLQSAASGCHFCSLVDSEMFDADKPVDGQTTSTGAVTLKITKKGKSLTGADQLRVDINCTTTMDRRTQDQTTVSFRVKNTPGMYDNPARIHPALAQVQTSSTEHVNLARSWIQSCLTRHRCGDRSDTRFVPTRLLKLSGCGADLTVRLYLTSARRDIGLSYCALSHCWGGMKVLCLNIANLEAFQQSIPLSDIPATYLDAIRIAQSIGVMYLWVDSLCIVQDSEDDWTEEASRMASVYENAYCTIAAAGAENSLDGCYVTRNPLVCGPCRILSTDTQDLYAHPAYKQLGSLDELEKTCGLFRRAWIFQELMLSPRLLYFGPKGICFSCDKGYAYESDIDGRGYPGGAGAPFEIEGVWRGERTSFQWVRNNTLSSSKVPHILHYIWFDIVYGYSSLALSIAGDKLVALSGMAERVISSHYGEEYVAGLWRSTFLSDLLWLVSDGASRARLSEFRAPTWSWASVEGAVYSHDPGSIDDLEISFMATVENINIVAHAKDRHKTGKVYGSSLEMRGLIKKAPLLPETEKAFYDSTEALVLHSKVSGQVRIDAHTKVRPEVYLMPLRRIREKVPHRHQKDRYWCQCGIAGLVLHKVDDGFERFGMFWMEAKDCEDGDFFDSVVSCYFDDCQEERIVFLDGNCRRDMGDLTASN